MHNYLALQDVLRINGDPSKYNYLKQFGHQSTKGFLFTVVTIQLEFQDFSQINNEEKKKQ